MSVEVITAERDALKAQLEAKDTELKTLKASKSALEKENEELKAAAKENEDKIADGETAREKAIEQNLEAFTAANLDMKEDELKAELASQEADLEAISLQKIYSNTDFYNRQAKKNTEGGRVTFEGGSDPDSDKVGPRPRR